MSCFDSVVRSSSVARGLPSFARFRSRWNRTSVSWRRVSAIFFLRAEIASADLVPMVCRSWRWATIKGARCSIIAVVAFMASSFSS